MAVRYADIIISSRFLPLYYYYHTHLIVCKLCLEMVHVISELLSIYCNVRINRC